MLAAKLSHGKSAHQAPDFPTYFLSWEAGRSVYAQCRGQDYFVWVTVSMRARLQVGASVLTAATQAKSCSDTHPELGSWWGCLGLLPQL